MFHIIYNFLCWVITIISAPFLFLYCLINSKQIASIKQRFGFFEYSETTKGNKIKLWFHAASVGEVQVAKAIIEETEKLIPNVSFIVTTVTEQGQKAAKQQLKDKAFCVYAPIDLSWVVKRFIKRLKPSCYICLETELWPNMIKTAAKNNVVLLLLNGRISKKSFTSYLKVKRFIKDILAGFSTISTIMGHDKERFIALGAQPDVVTVNGNAKYDNNLLNLQVNNTSENSKGIGTKDKITARKKAIIDYYRRKLCIKGTESIFIAGSTHGDEEAQLIETFTKLKASIPDLILILAPRHITRVGKIESFFKEENIQYQLYSELANDTRKQEIVIVDSMGELASLYSIADYVFCGGSLVPKGGHNIMEAAIWGTPPIYGPYMSDFSDAKQMLEEQQAGFTVKDNQELFEQISYFHSNPSVYKGYSKKAESIANAQHGSAKRQAKIIQHILFN